VFKTGTEEGDSWAHKPYGVPPCRMRISFNPLDETGTGEETRGLLNLAASRPAGRVFPSIPPGKTGTEEETRTPKPCGTCS
jgi:hypothetical protein